MNPSQFKRQATILISESNTWSGQAIQIQNLRVTFSIKKTSTTDFNSASIQVFNLSEETRQRINSIPVGNIIIVKAGYAENKQEIIFVGNTVLSSINVEPPNAVTKIEALDGMEAMNQLKFSVSYAAGTFATKILKDILRRSSLDIKHIDWNKIPDKQYKTGFAFQGDAKVLFNNVCNYLGVEWSIQNNQMKLIPIGGADTAKIVYLTPETGLIGSPEKLRDDAMAAYQKDVGKNVVKVVGMAGKKYKKSIGGGYRIKCLLQPYIEPGSVVQVRSAEIPDIKFRAVEVEHTGDTHGNDWYTIINGMTLT